MQNLHTILWARGWWFLGVDRQTTIATRVSSLRGDLRNSCGDLDKGDQRGGYAVLRFVLIRLSPLSRSL